MMRWFGCLVLPVAAMLLVGCAPASRVNSQNDRVLFLLGEEYDPLEFWGPYATLCTAGYKVDLAGPAKGMELTPDSYVPEANVRMNVALEEVHVSQYLALVVPGGPGAANIARFPKARQIARDFNAAGKSIGAVCHGARLLMPEGIFKGGATTAVFMVADELCDQWKSGDYGTYLDLPVVIDRNLTCSRDPRDVPVWSRALLTRLAASGGLKPAQWQDRVLIVLPGATQHQKWVLDRLSIFGLTPTVWNETQTKE
jgi:protease I